MTIYQEPDFVKEPWPKMSKEGITLIKSNFLYKIRNVDEGSSKANNT